MSDTPRTDEEVEIAKQYPATCNGLFISVNFARILEMELSAAEAKVDALMQQVDAHRASAVDNAMCAYKWMKAHDALHANEPYDYPSPADLPQSIARAEAAEASVAILMREKEELIERCLNTIYQWRDHAEAVAKAEGSDARRKDVAMIDMNTLAHLAEEIRALVREQNTHPCPDCGEPLVKGSLDRSGQDY